MAAIPLAERLERKVDRRGEHHFWLGTRDAEDAGQVRVNGKLRTARSVAWELEHGALPEGARVRGCPDEPACVRVSHLALWVFDSEELTLVGDALSWPRTGVVLARLGVGVAARVIAKLCEHPGAEEHPSR